VCAPATGAVRANLSGGRGTARRTRLSATPKPARPASAAVKMFVVAHVRQMPQQACAAGARSAFC
jgi:hypothetical protein